MGTNETKSLVKLDPVTVHVTSDGNVKSVTNKSGIDVPFIQKLALEPKKNVLSPELLSKFKLMFDPEHIDEDIVCDLEELLKQSRSICLLPGLHMRKKFKYPRCCVLDFDCTSEIDPDNIPIDLSYATCMSICEIDNRVGTMELGDAYFNSEEFLQRFQGLKDAIFRDDYECECSNYPGIVGKGKLYELLKRYTVEDDIFWKDPMKKIYRPNFLDDWTPYLSRSREDNFVSLCSSDWKMMNQKVKNEFGHIKPSNRYYIILGWGIPVSLCDQVKHCVKVRGEEKYRWGDLVHDSNLSYEIITAEKISRIVTENILDRTFDHLGLKKSHDFKVSSYLSNVFRYNSQDNSINFYNESICTKDDSDEGGVLTMRGNSPRDGFIWWGGDYTRKKRLGSSWCCENTMNGFPSRVFNVVDGVEINHVEKQYVWGNLRDRNRDFQPRNNVGFMKLENVISI